MSWAALRGAGMAQGPSCPFLLTTPSFSTPSYQANSSAQASGHMGSSSYPNAPQPSSSSDRTALPQCSRTGGRSPAWCPHTGTCPALALHLPCGKHGQQARAASTDGLHRQDGSPHIQQQRRATVAWLVWGHTHAAAPPVGVQAADGGR